LREKIVAISVGFPGVVRALKHGRDLKLWDLVVLSEQPVHIPRADAYILGAWHKSYSQLLKELPENSRIGILWTSSAGEMDLEQVEISYLAKIIDNERIDCVLFSTEALANSFKKGVFFPYPIVIRIPLTKKQEKQEIITLFCPPTFKKNVLNQLLAVKELQKTREIKLHTNLLPYKKIMKWLGLNFELHNWLPEKEYYSLLSRSKCNLGVSWAESFNYQVLEAALCNTFSVVSPSVWWYPEKDLMVLNPNNPLEILQKMLECIKKNESCSIGSLLEKALPIVKNNNSKLKKVLEQWLGYRNPY